MQYRVVETVQFRELWQSALEVGVIDFVAEHLLEGFAEFLSLEPHYFPLFETVGEPFGLRWALFIESPKVSVEIWYSVVEDDLTVYLESVEVIYPPQQTLPGFDV